MSGPAEYRNYGHYVAEGWSDEPKRAFVALAGLIAARRPAGPGALLDVGCATGELLGHLAPRLPGWELTGVDIFEALLAAARRNLPDARFAHASALALPAHMSARFDIVCALGCMSIFDDAEVGTFWDNLLRAARPGGCIFVLAPLNEHGVDTMIRHRTRRGGARGPWETGWNIFSIETVEELLAARGVGCEIVPFRIDIDLPRRDDPVRTWTVPMQGKERQLVNGLKLMIDHYFLIVRRDGG